MTYAELKAKVAAYLNRDDLTSYIPGFIEMAQRKIERGGDYAVNNRIVKVSGYYDCMKTRKYTSTSDMEITLPSDFLAPIGLWAVISDEYTPLARRLPEEIWATYPDPTNHTGTPEEYTILIGENEIIVRPTPDKSYTFDFQYYKSLTVLSDDADTNAWTTDYWEILLYGALLEAQAFLIADERLGTWLTLFGQAVFSLENRDTMANAAGGTLFIKPYYSDN
jgi:hypothetical protein